MVEEQNQPPNDERKGAPKALVTVNFEREVDVTTGRGETRRFVKMYFEARDSGLLAAMPDELWKTLCVLATYLDENGHCFPSQEQLAKDLGIGRQAANKRIQRLREFHFNGKPIIAIARSTVRQGVGGARRDKNTYQLYPIAGFHFGDKRQQETDVDSQMSRRGDNREIIGNQSRSRVGQTSGGHDSNKNNDNDSNVNVAGTDSITDRRQDNSIVQDPRKSGVPTVAFDALHKRYGLSDKQCGEVLYLVDLQKQLLGSAAQNHSAYVHRAATVTQLGLAGRFAATLRDFDERCKRTPPKKGRPQLFHSIWREQQETYQRTQENPIGDIVKATVAAMDSRFAQPSERGRNGERLDPQEQRRREYVARLEAEGYELPPHIRSASFRDIAHWLDEQPVRTEHPPKST